MIKQIFTILITVFVVGRFPPTDIYDLRIFANNWLMPTKRPYIQQEPMRDYARLADRWLND